MVSSLVLGRDGLPSFCYLYYKQKDVTEIKKIIQAGPGDIAIKEERLVQLERFHQVIQGSHRCLRQSLLLQLDELWISSCIESNSLPCPYCLNPPPLISLSVEVEVRRFLDFLQQVTSLEEQKVVPILLGTYHSHQESSIYALLRKWTKDLVQHFVEEMRLTELVGCQYEIVEDIPTNILKITRSGMQFLSDSSSEKAMLVPRKLMFGPYFNPSKATTTRNNVKRHHDAQLKRFEPKKKHLKRNAK